MSWVWRIAGIYAEGVEFLFYKYMELTALWAAETPHDFFYI